jgi:hypothetical protein
MAADNRIEWLLENQLGRIVTTPDPAGSGDWWPNTLNGRTAEQRGER